MKSYYYMMYRRAQRFLASARLHGGGAADKALPVLLEQIKAYRDRYRQEVAGLRPNRLVDGVEEFGLYKATAVIKSGPWWWVYAGDHGMVAKLSKLPETQDLIVTDSRKLAVPSGQSVPDCFRIAVDYDPATVRVVA